MEQQNSTAPATADASEAPPQVWRNEVHARVAGYRSRRGRRIEGAFSMRFPFPPENAASAPEANADSEGASDATPLESAAVNAGSDAPSASAVEFFQNNEVGAQSLPEMPAVANAADERQEIEPAPARRARRKVIAFPRPATEPREPWSEPPLPDQPRILDVPEQLPAYPTTPLLDGLQFPSREPQAAAASADHVELPLQAVAVGQRLRAGVVDGAIVFAATGIFAAACYKLLPRLTLTKPLLATAAAMPLLLWAAYHYLFLIYAGATAGMRRAGIRLSSFKGGFPSRRQRRNRCIALFFSTASLTMGLLWALVDVDALCWHDRISRTYLTKSGG